MAQSNMNLPVRIIQIDNFEENQLQELQESTDLSNFHSTAKIKAL